MDVDIPEMLRPTGTGAPGALDVDDIRRRVRRRRRNRAVAAVAIVAVAVPVAVRSLPMRTYVEFGPAAQPGADSQMPASVAAVLASADMTFTPSDPGAEALPRDEAVRTARRQAGDTVDPASASAFHGTLIDRSDRSAPPRAVWAVRFVTAAGPQRGDAGEDGATAVAVVVIDAASGNGIATVGMTDPDADEQEVSAEVSLGAGTAGGSAPAQPMRALGRGRSPELAALDAAGARGHDDAEVRNVVFITARDTRVLVDDSTGCWVYAAVLADDEASWEATGGTTPCDP